MSLSTVITHKFAIVVAYSFFSFLSFFFRTPIKMHIKVEHKISDSLANEMRQSNISL